MSTTRNRRAERYYRVPAVIPVNRAERRFLPGGVQCRRCQPAGRQGGRAMNLCGVFILLAIAVHASNAAVLRSRSDLGYGDYQTVITGVAVDAQGFIYETGLTGLPDFPTTQGPLSQSRGGGLFVRKLTPDGATIIYSVLV